MIASKAIKTRYDEVAVHAPALQRLVREQLAPFCETNHFGFYDRIKTLESVAEKLETGRVRSWDELDDLYAATIVVPSLRDEEPALREVRNVFQEVRLRSRASTRTPPDVFRFDSPRFIGRLLPSLERESSPVASMLFEVQVRTAFEHAWSITTHALTYKSDHSDWRRLRLTALLRASVEQIDLALAGFERTAIEVLPGAWEESEVKLALLTRYKVLFETGRLPSEIRPAAWSRFIDNLFSLCDAEAKRRRNAKVKDIADEAMTALERWANTTRIEEIPRSLSLFQTSFGVLCRSAVLAKGIRFVVFGSDDIKDVFPEAKSVASEEH